jgi:hypothetical protein
MAKSEFPRFADGGTGLHASVCAHPRMHVVHSRRQIRWLLARGLSIRFFSSFFWAISSDPIQYNPYCFYSFPSYSAWSFGHECSLELSLPDTLHKYARRPDAVPSFLFFAVST